MAPEGGEFRRFPAILADEGEAFRSWEDDAMRTVYDRALDCWDDLNLFTQYGLAFVATMAAIFASTWVAPF